jgi:hypothetical protein
MTYTDIMAYLDEAMSEYVDERVVLMRAGKYPSGYHYMDGYLGMIAETLAELIPADDYYPLDKDMARVLIFTFNKKTYKHVPDIWT